MMETNKQQSITAYIENLSPAQMVIDEKVSGKFIQLYEALHVEKKGKSIYQKEQFNFMKLLNENTSLQECTKLSLYGCFLDVAVMGLSLDQGTKPLAYMLPRKAKTKNANGAEVWESRASITVSPYGELVMRIRAGQIKRADNPIIVYEGDIIKVGLSVQGHRVVKEYEAAIPRKKDALIIGGFIRLERHDGSFENPWIDISEMDRLKNYSAKNNAKWEDDLDTNGNRVKIGTEPNGSPKYRKKRVIGDANALFSSNNGQIDPGFFEAKIIKHAFRSYPKIRVGEFTTLQTQVDDEHKIDYNLGEQKQEPIQNAEIVSEKKQDDNSFAEPVQETAMTVTYQNSDEF
jgi:recombinational DNA repair protein RecT